ncbi:hypothetical protein [Pontibacter sp. G13]|uniref:hypothetical protein n=1 Tax=Pontibacter sp. G13 TaxID=3074898 RepID=UPI00288B7648|nr:hypothetical protein [Pontibacter sp. G13]WNJ18534.1 hypothetical protein RJD25_27070 [Pontibacter sp. G13]
MAHVFSIPVLSLHLCSAGPTPYFSESREQFYQVPTLSDIGWTLYAPGGYPVNQGFYQVADPVESPKWRRPFSALTELREIIFNFNPIIIAWDGLAITRILADACMRYEIPLLWGDNQIISLKQVSAQLHGTASHVQYEPQHIAQTWDLSPPVDLSPASWVPFQWELFCQMDLTDWERFTLDKTEALPQMGRSTEFVPDPVKMSNESALPEAIQMEHKSSRSHLIWTGLLIAIMSICTSTVGLLLEKPIVHFLSVMLIGIYFLVATTNR